MWSPFLDEGSLGEKCWHSSSIRFPGRASITRSVASSGGPGGCVLHFHVIVLAFVGGGQDTANDYAYIIVISDLETSHVRT